MDALVATDAHGDGLDPGWDPDPTGRHQLRWWDGAQWTDQVSDFGVLSTDRFVRTNDVTAADPSRAFSGRSEASEDAVQLAETVEALVGRLREISKKDKRVATDRELRALAQDALERARRLRPPEVAG